MAKGTLYVVATPIGNLGDLTRRAAEVLGNVEHVAAEDTRRTRQLLSHLGVGGKTLHRVDAHASASDLDRVVDVLEQGHDVALATDAGTPAVSDPGSALVARAVARGHTVVPIPGASAVLAALVASGLSGDRGFRFFGFLPREGPERSRDLARIAETPEPVVLFESPHRTKETLEELAFVSPQRSCAVARELTKLHEEIVRGTLTELAADTREWKGEVVLVLGAHATESRETEVDDAQLDARIDAGLAEGLHAKTLAERLSAFSGRPKREVYERVVMRKSKAPRG
jgi:16S rRNA (cytidine1402-2'-O)-methyltransferase